MDIIYLITIKLERLQNRGQIISLMYFDIDHFKRLNRIQCILLFIISNPIINQEGLKISEKDEPILKKLLELRLLRRQELILDWARDVVGELKSPIGGLPGTPRIVLHLVPTNSYMLVPQYDLSKIKHNKLKPLNCKEWSHEYNFNGVFTTCKNKAATYVQFYRAGIIEAVDTTLCNPEGELRESFFPHGERIIPIGKIEAELVESLREYISFYKSIHVEMPIYLFLSLTNIHFWCFLLDEKHRKCTDPSKQHSLRVPEIRIDSLDVPANAILRPCFDILWNALGFKKAPSSGQG